MKEKKKKNINRQEEVEGPQKETFTKPLPAVERDTRGLGRSNKRNYSRTRGVVPSARKESKKVHTTTRSGAGNFWRKCSDGDDFIREGTVSTRATKLRERSTE